MSKIFAHRGASGRHFENTMRAFQAAAEQGADGIELDVQQTADGLPVVLHDDNLLRTAGIDRQIDQVASQELEQIKVGKNGRRRLFGHAVPSLFDAVSFCAAYGLSLNIELKDTVYSQPEVLQQVLNYAGALDDVHISSFDYPTLQLIRELDPCMETALLVRKKTVDWQQLADYDTDGLHFHKRLWKEPYRTALLESGKKLRMYGITGSEEFLSASPEISGWITDYPKRVRKKIKGSR